MVSGATGRILYSVPGDQAWFGHAVSGVGDIDGDGSWDFAVADPEAGTASLYSGADGALLRELHGDEAGDRFGEAVAGAGDVNGDGVPDVVVGSRRPTTARTAKPESPACFPAPTAPCC